MTETKLQMIVRPGSGQIGSHRLFRPFQIVGMHAHAPLCQVIGYLVVGITDLALPFGRVVDLVGAQIPIPQADIGGSHGHAQPLFCGQEIGFSLAAPADIEGDNLKRRTSPILKSRCRHFNRHHAAIEANIAIFYWIESQFTVHHAHDTRLGCFPSVGVHQRLDRFAKQVFRALRAKS